MYHGRKDVTPSHFLLHEGHRFGEIGLHLLLVSACKNSGLAVMRVSTNMVLSFRRRHPAVLMRMSISFRYFCTGWMMWKLSLLLLMSMSGLLAYLSFVRS